MLCSLLVMLSPASVMLSIAFHTVILSERSEEFPYFSQNKLCKAPPCFAEKCKDAPSKITHAGHSREGVNPAKTTSHAGHDDFTNHELAKREFNVS